MKKIIVSLTAIIALVFTGCFIDSDTATVRINLGNLPVAKVEKKSFVDRLLMIFSKEAVAMDDNPPETGLTKVHFGAFDSNNQLLAKKTILLSDYLVIYNNDNLVEFLVPARSGVTIVVLGEGDNDNLNKIKYYGKSMQLNLTAGATYSEQINMYELNEAYLEFQEGEGDYLGWKNISGASSYIIYNWEQTEPYWQGTKNYFYEWDHYSTDLIINFDFVNKATIKIIYWST